MSTQTAEKLEPDYHIADLGLAECIWTPPVKQAKVEIKNKTRTYIRFSRGDAIS